MEDYKKTSFCTQVQVLRDGKAIKSLIFNQDKIIIGRILSVDLIVDDISISRIHAAIDISDDGELSVSDLGSINGVVLNGKKVAEAKISSGSKVKLGDVEILVHLFKEEEIESSPQPRVPIVEYYSELDDIVDLKKLASSRTVMVSEEGGKSYSVKSGFSGIFPLPRDREKGSIIESVLFLNDSIIDVKHIKNPKRLLIGHGSGNDFIFGAEVLPVRLPVLQLRRGKYYVNVMDGMNGFIQKGNKNIPFDNIKNDPETIRDDDLYSFKIDSKDIVRIEVGKVTLFFLFVGESVPIEKKRIVEPDPPYHTSLFISFVLHLILMLIFMTAEVPHYVRLDGIEDRFVNLIIEQKKPVFQEKLKQKTPEKAKVEPPKREEEPPKPRVQEQKAKKEPTVEKKRTPPVKKEIVSIDRVEDKTPVKAPLPDATKIMSEKGEGTGDGLKRKASKSVKSVGILGALNKGAKSGSLSNVFGKEGVGIGTGKNIVGPRGVKGGATSYGIKDISGGVGKTFGIGSGNVLGEGGAGAPGVVNASGALRGKSGISLNAFNSLKGSKYTGTTSMSESNTVVIGSLTKEQIWAVVEKHFSEIQNCYEVALQGDRNLTGKVDLHWVIGADGRVQVVNVRATTLKNVYAESCMTNRVKYWLFPKPRGGGIVRVNFPFVFKPL